MTHVCTPSHQWHRISPVLQEWSVFSVSTQQISGKHEHSVWDLELGTQRSQVQAPPCPPNTGVRAEVHMCPMTWTQNLPRKEYSTLLSFYSWKTERKQWKLWGEVRAKFRKIFKSWRWLIRTILQKIPSRSVHLIGTCKTHACHQTHSTQERFRIHWTYRGWNLRLLQKSKIQSIDRQDRLPEVVLGTSLTAWMETQSRKQKHCHREGCRAVLEEQLGQLQRTQGPHTAVMTSDAWLPARPCLPETPTSGQFYDRFPSTSKFSFFCSFFLLPFLFVCLFVVF